MSKVITSDSQLAELLSKTKRVAVVGISDKEDRPSNGVSRWLAEEFSLRALLCKSDFNHSPR
jgi:predicted CoA-binding protein